MSCQVIPRAVRFELVTENGCFPRVEVLASADVVSLTLDIDAVELSKFKAEVCRFIEERLPSYIKVADRTEELRPTKEGGAGK